ncbi:DUF6913 domain-containing protein [Ekhidna sp.]|uniref:DUF6913 domain-containing protein n=1 Tax=Ekhidna sp. TaxID=2608089 RepID=UPI003B5C98F5
MSHHLENFYTMIKTLFLKHKGKPTIADKEHCTYAESSNIGILYNSLEFTSESVSKLEELLKNDGKEIAKMGFADKPSENKLMFSKKDISSTGTVKKDQLDFFIKQPFDFLISLDTSENRNYKYVLALSKATCKVGFETEQYYDLLQLSLKMDESKPKAVANIVRYLKMI